MSIRSKSVCGLFAMSFLLMSSANATGWGQNPQRLAQSGTTSPPSKVMASQPCTSYSINDNIDSAGDTWGFVQGFTGGDFFTFTATGNGTGTWRIVGDGGGAQTLASGGTFPGTLTFEVPTGQVQPGVGYYVDSYSGTGDTITASCGSSPHIPIPTQSTWSLLLMVMLLGLIGFAAFRRKHTH